MEYWITAQDVKKGPCTACSECESFWELDVIAANAKTTALHATTTRLLRRRLRNKRFFALKDSFCSDYSQCECGTNVCDVSQNGCTWNGSSCIQTPVCQGQIPVVAFTPLVRTATARQMCWTRLTDYYCNKQFKRLRK